MENTLAQLLEENIEKVWSERDADRRRGEIERIYAEDGSLFEVSEIITGRDAINEKVSALLSGMPADFVFTRLKPVIINNNVGRLLWALGPKDALPVTTGMDLAIFENQKIKSLYVFLDA